MFFRLKYNFGKEFVAWIINQTYPIVWCNHFGRRIKRKHIWIQRKKKQLKKKN